ncbi:MAG TPA: hypothetical protein VK607_17820 [Kofleriaceae bacterium]|nr:hypothetical protein [Kofleriaceae bacterium]
MQSSPSLVAGLALAAAACGNVAATPDAGAGSGTDDGSASALDACSPTNLDACRYTSDLQFEVGVADVDLTDPARANLPVPLRVHYPVGATDARPVVIWNHGGAPGANGRTRSEEWGTALAAAGYVVIHPSRVPVTVTPAMQTICDREGFPSATECPLFIAQRAFGPITAVFALDSLAAIEAQVPALAGRIDATRVAIAGHSAGSPVALALAGATRQFAGPPHHDADPRPLAFLATGPHGPDYAAFEDGFHEDSFHDIDARPFLWITGRGDETGDDGEPQHEPSEARTAGWLTSTRGNKLLSWDNDEVTVHESMDIHKCDQTPVQRTHCDAFAMLGTAFMDAFLRQRDVAVAYLASSAYDTLNAGVIELHRR